MTDRIMELEERLAHFEHALLQLDEVVRDVAKQVEVLRDEVERLRKGLDDPEDGPGGDKYEIPPHY